MFFALACLPSFIFYNKKYFMAQESIQPRSGGLIGVFCHDSGVCLVPGWGMALGKG